MMKITVCGIVKDSDDEDNDNDEEMIMRKMMMMMMVKEVGNIDNARI